jgi:hypothetical protein
MSDEQTALERKSEAEWELRLPGVPVRILWRAIEFYMTTSASSPKDIAAELDEIMRCAVRLNARFYDLSSDSHDLFKAGVYLVEKREGSGFHFDWGALSTQLDIVRRGARLASRSAANAVKRGKGGEKSRKARLIHMLADELTTAGLEASSRPIGPLVLAAGVVFSFLANLAEAAEADSGLGQARKVPADIPGSVRHALKTWRER